MKFTWHPFSFRYSERTEPVPSGLKARFTLAWGEAPGHNNLSLGGLKARAKRLIPHKPLVELHPIFREHRPHLGLKISPLMMRGLGIDIPHQRRPISKADRKNCIAALPTELRKLRALRFDPLGRRDLQSLDHSRNRLRPREEQRDMNVIGNAANANADIFRSIQNRGQVRMHLGSDCIIQQRTPVLRTKHQMHKNVRKGLGHDGKYSASFQPADVTPTPTWGFAPGYKIADLQSASLRTLTNPANNKFPADEQSALSPNQTTTPIPIIPNTRRPISGPKARVTLAWSNAPGNNRPITCGLKARAKRLMATTAAALILPICGIPTAHAQPAPPLHIKIINAKTNPPVTNERLNVALRTDQIGSVPMATDKNGIILVDTGQATTIRILANMNADCRPRAELYTDYSIDTIRRSGITTGNLCGGRATAAKPGELVLFEVPKTFIPAYPAPPLPPPPHSDETLTNPKATISHP